MCVCVFITYIASIALESQASSIRLHNGGPTGKAWEEEKLSYHK